MLDKKIQIYHFAEIPSTNDFFLTRELNNKTELCIADNQTNGKGQYGRTWLNQKRNALFSLKINIDKINLSGLSLVVAISIIQVLTKNYNIKNLSIKWPNDIYLANKKLAGILIENREFENKFNIIIGVGINISGSANFANIDKNINSKQLIMRIVDKILDNTDEFSKNQLLNFMAIWQKYDYLVQNNKQAKYNDNIYQIIGINELGNLLIKKNEKEVLVSSSKQIQIL